MTESEATMFTSKENTELLSKIEYDISMLMVGEVTEHNIKRSAIVGAKYAWESERANILKHIDSYKKLLNKFRVSDSLIGYLKRDVERLRGRISKIDRYIEYCETTHYMDFK